MAKKEFCELNDILTAKEISDYLDVSYNYALTLIKYKMKHIKLGNTYRVTKTAFGEFLGL